MSTDHQAFTSALVLTGPTGSGKSLLALALAPSLNAEIVAMDSMTLYCGLNIGTAKPTAAERAQTPHHLLDVREPHEPASVAWWLEAAAEACRDIVGRGRRPLFVGGTPLYLKALLFGLFDGPSADTALRAELERLSDAELHARLRSVDAASADRLHPHDRRRVVRALEVFHLTGRPMSDWQREWAGPPLLSPTVALDGVDVPRVVCLEWPREELYRRIDARVEAMVAAGWLNEVRELLELEPPPSREAWAAVGYRDLVEVVAGSITLPAAVTRIQQRSRNYAKQQMTWFRGLAGVRWLSAELKPGVWSGTMRELAANAKEESS